MNIYLSSKFKKSYKVIIKSTPKNKAKIKKTISTLQEDPKHPGLRLHKLSGNKGEMWSISVDRKIRITLTFTEQDITLVNIGTHDEDY